LRLEKILIINPFGVGDVIFTSPLIRRLRKQFKSSFIAYLCNGRVAPLLAENKNINKLYVFDKDDYRIIWRRSRPGTPWHGKFRLQALKKLLIFLKTIKSEKFDVAIDLSLGHQYAFFLMLFGVRARIGYNFKGRGRFFTHKIDIDGYHDKHIVEYYLDLLQVSPLTHSLSPMGRGIKGEGARDDYAKLEIFIPQKDLDWADDFLKNNGITANERLLAVIPGGGASWGKAAIYKQWPPENFAQAADELSQRYNMKVILLGSAGDAPACDIVSRSMRNRPVSACGLTNLLQFAALMKRCKLALCNDGGPLHIAVALGINTVSVFGPVDDVVYGPYPASEKHIVIKEDINCRPCYKGFKFKECDNRLCLLNIKPLDIVKSAEKLL